MTPNTPQVNSRNETIDRISPDFYDILDEASAAEQSHLMLIAGMGYRKALEFLIKDYATDTESALLESPRTPGDEAAMADAEAQVAAVRKELLSQTIDRRISNINIREVAKRCAWLGNDQVHYTRKWDKHDVRDLKKLLSLTLNFISDEADARLMIAEMPPKMS